MLVFAITSATIGTMGSGKGKSRRASASAPSAAVADQRVVWDEDKWNSFVRNTGLDYDGVNGMPGDGVKLEHYYLGEREEGVSERGEDIVADFVRMYAELFADAIAVGAISLPVPYKAEDFEFKASPHPPDDPNIAVVLKTQPQFEQVIDDESGLSGGDPLSSVYVADQLCEIALKVNMLLPAS